MTELKATKGPWAVCQEGFSENPNHVTIDAPTHHSLAEVVWVIEDDKRTPECEANTHLIAAAPDLYEALENILFENSDKSEEEKLKDKIKGRLALAKARGDFFYENS